MWWIFPLFPLSPSDPLCGCSPSNESGCRNWPRRPRVECPVPYKSSTIDVCIARKNWHTNNRHPKTYLLATSVAIKIDRSWLVNLFKAPRRFDWKGRNDVVVSRTTNRQEDGRTMPLGVPDSFGRWVVLLSTRDFSTSTPRVGYCHKFCRKPCKNFQPTHSRCKPTECPEI